MALARRHIVGELLTLKCPRCSQAFLDFSGCFALTCSKCGCGFCGWCLKDCGKDAHTHVARCSQSLEPGQVFATEDKFTQAQSLRREQEVKEYICSQVETDLRADVYRACQQELRDLGIAARLQSLFHHESDDPNTNHESDDLLARCYQAQMDSLIDWDDGYQL